jgi:hypothetical protein
MMRDFRQNFPGTPTAFGTFAPDEKPPAGPKGATWTTNRQGEWTVSRQKSLNRAMDLDEDHDYQGQSVPLEYIRRRRMEGYHDALAVTEALEQFVASVQI